MVFGFRVQGSRFKVQGLDGGGRGGEGAGGGGKGVGGRGGAGATEAGDGAEPSDCRSWSPTKVTRTHSRQKKGADMWLWAWGGGHNLYTFGPRPRRISSFLFPFSSF